jgi:hypothetical protein
VRGCVSSGASSRSSRRAQGNGTSRCRHARAASPLPHSMRLRSTRIRTFVSILMTYGRRGAEGVPPDSRLIVTCESIEERGAELRHRATFDPRRVPDAVAHTTPVVQPDIDRFLLRVHTEPLAAYEFARSGNSATRGAARAGECTSARNGARIANPWQYSSGSTARCGCESKDRLNDQCGIWRRNNPETGTVLISHIAGNGGSPGQISVRRRACLVSVRRQTSAGARRTPQRSPWARCGRRRLEEVRSASAGAQNAQHGRGSGPEVCSRLRTESN